MVNWISIHPPGDDLDAESQAEFSKIRTELHSAANQLTSAESKLLLLGETKSQKLLRDYGEGMKAYRDIALVDQRTITIERLNEMKARILEKRLALFSELSTIYDRSFDR